MGTSWWIEIAKSNGGGLQPEEKGLQFPSIAIVKLFAAGAKGQFSGIPSLGLVTTPKAGGAPVLYVLVRASPSRVSVNGIRHVAKNVV